MSKLTNHQIKAQIDGLEKAFRHDAQRGDIDAMKRRQKKIDAYLTELGERQAAGADPRTHEIQTVRHGEKAQ